LAELLVENSALDRLDLIALPDGVESEPMPIVALKGKSRQVQLYAVRPTVPEHAMRRGLDVERVSSA